MSTPALQMFLFRAFDVTFISVLSSAIIKKASAAVGAAAFAAEVRKHTANDAKCQELGWSCIQLAVETYGNWGKEAQCALSRLASHACHRPGQFQSKNGCRDLWPSELIFCEISGQSHLREGVS